MKKWILIGCVLIIVIVAGVVFFGLSNLGPIIKTAVNTYGPEITKTQVRLGNVGISLFAAEASLQDFYLGNPQGFNSPDAITVGSIVVDVDETSLTKDTIVIDRIEVVSPVLNYEKTAKGDNFKTIMNNIQQAAGGSSKGQSASEQGQGGGGKKIVIRDFSVKQGRVNLAMSLPGVSQNISTPLPDIHLTDIGQDKGGVSPAQAFKVVFAKLYQQVTSPAVAGVLNKELKALGLDSQDAQQKAQKGIESVTDKVKGLLGK